MTSRVRLKRLALASLAVFGLQTIPRQADAAALADAPPPSTDPAPVTLDHQSFHRGHVTIEIPHLEARGTSLTASDLKDILDPASSLTAAQRLARLSATSITIPAINLRPDPKAGEAPDQIVTLHDVQLSDIQAGKAATVSIKSVDGQFRSGQGERDILSAGAILAHAVDPTLALTIATGKRTDAALPISPIYKDVSVAGMSFKAGDDVTIAVDRLESGAFEGRPLLETPSELAAMSDKGMGGAESPEKSRFFTVLFDAAASFKLDTLQVSGLSVDDKGSEAFTFKLRSMVVQGLESLKLDLLRADEMAFQAQAAQVTLKSATLSNLDRGAMVQAVMGKLVGLTSPVTGLFDTKGPAGTEFKLDALHVAIPTTDADSPFPMGTVNVIDVPSLQTGEGVSKGGTEVENHAHVEVRYDMPPGGSDASLQALRDAGLAHLDLTFDSRIAYDTTARELRVDEIALDGKTLGGFTVSGRVGDLPDSPFAIGRTSDELATQFAKATFRDLKVTATDRGIIGSALPVIARTSGTAPALFKAGLKTQVDLQLPALLGQTPAEAKVAAAIDGLLDAPGTLVVAFHSPHGVTFNDIANADDPADIMRRLEVTADMHH